VIVARLEKRQTLEEEIPQAPDPARQTGGRAKPLILADGKQVTIDARADFADTIVEAYGDYLLASGGRPRPMIRAEIEQTHLEWTPEQIDAATDKQLDVERSAAGAKHFSAVIGKDSMQYRLAAMAIGSNNAWARKNLYADEAQQIVTTGCEIAGMEDYIKNSLTFPVSTVSSQTAAEIKKAMKEAEKEAAAEADADAAATPQAERSSDESEPSSAGTTD